MKTLNEFLKEDKKVLKEANEVKQAERMLDKLNKSLQEANGHALSLSLYLDKIMDDRGPFPAANGDNLSMKDLEMIHDYRAVTDVIQDGLISIIENRKKIK